MQNTKVLFFDIDGTLVGFDGEVPASTIKALQSAKANGHRLVLCTGRSIGQIYPYLIKLGFDGIVAAAGAQVYVGEDLIECHNFGSERINSVIDYLESNKITYFLAAPNSSTIPTYCVKTLTNELSARFEGVPEEHILEELEKTLGKFLLDRNPQSHPDDFASTEGVVYCASPFTIHEMRKHLAPLGLQITESSFKDIDEYSGEITLKGISKASGMDAMLKYLGYTREDSIAFGDGPNDIEMMKFAGISVAMGNAVEITKKNANIVTDDIDHEGIEKAMSKLGLI